MQNIFLVSLPPNVHIKIDDFGISKHSRQRIDGETTRLQTLDAYTLGYAAPETMHPLVRSYTPAVDLWALGITVFQILNSGGHPFFDDDEQGDYCEGYEETNPWMKLRDGISKDAVYSAAIG